MTPKLLVRSNAKTSLRDLCLRNAGAIQILGAMSDQSSPPAATANSPPSRGSVSLGFVILFLITAGLIVAAAMTADSFVSRWVLERATPLVKNTAQFLSKSGEGQWPIGFGLVVAIIGWKYGRDNWRRAGFVIAVAAAVAGVAAIGVRAATGRTRPSNKTEQGWFGPYHDGQWAAFRHSYSSFPSGHTATAAGFAMALTYVARRWGWLSLFWMLGVGWSRICLDSHHFSDVIAGLFFGWVTAWFVLRAFGWPRLDQASSG